MGASTGIDNRDIVRAINDLTRAIERNTKEQKRACEAITRLVTQQQNPSKDKEKNVESVPGQ